MPRDLRNQFGAIRVALVIGAAVLVACLIAAVLAADPPIHSDKPNILAFPAQEAKFVRFVIRATSGDVQPCIDELEVYSPDNPKNLALASNGGKATASSLLEGYVQHAIEHLNDGEYGNAQSWIPATSSEEWAQIQLPDGDAGNSRRAVPVVSKVVFSRDRLRQYGDRVPTDVEVLLSTDGKEWKSVRRWSGPAVSGATGGAVAGPTPVVPNPPPPPQVSKEGAVLVSHPLDDKVSSEDDLGFANLSLRPAAKAAASSLLPGFPIHQIPHLNDGLLGNSHSWIGAEDPSWAEIDLGDVCWVYKVAFGSDSSQQFGDRAATAFTILAATDHAEDSSAKSWKPVYEQTEGEVVHVRTEFKFKPVQARWVRVAVQSGTSGPTRIDELEVYGQKDAIPLAKIGPLPEAKSAQPKADMDKLLRYAFLSEEHAWVKTYGRADLDPTLVPYNGRVKEYPRHVGDDTLPLPPLSSAPKLDGDLSDGCWGEASQGVVRVAAPWNPNWQATIGQDFANGPLANHILKVGVVGDNLCMALHADRLLSGHVAVVSGADWQGCGVVALDKDGLVFNTYTREGENQPKLQKSTPIDGAFNKDFTCCEMRLPLSLFPDCRDRGLRVGLGMGGKHTSPVGRPLNLVFSSLAVSEEGECANHVFQVRLRAASGANPITVSGNVPGSLEGLTLSPGESKVVSVPAIRGSLGPEFNLTLNENGVGNFNLHLFRYDPLERTLVLMDAMTNRLAAKRVDVTAQRRQLTKLRERHDELVAAKHDPVTERETFFEARLAKRQLFLREPDLAPVSKLLLVKRNPYHPSHIYTDYFDAPFRPGGGVFTLEVPRHDGSLHPEEAKLTKLFDSKGGVARDPVATFGLDKIYFGYRPSASGHYHLMAMKADGSDLKQLTDGPFHDFYPCPLPDGGVALISTRCTSRVFCFRAGSSVLCRMDPDGSDLRKLSFSSLSEWAPSVMNDGRIIWTRWEYLDKGADFSQTLWSVRPDGTDPELVFGNTVIQPNGYANGRQVPGTDEICSTLVSHFGDINGPIALLDLSKGRMNPKAISSITPEVPWPGMWPATECFRDPVPLARDYFLCAHAPRDRFGLYVIDRYGNRELIYLDPAICSMGPTVFRSTTPPPSLPNSVNPKVDKGRFIVMDVYKGIEPTVPRGSVKYLRVVEEVRHNISATPDFDHADFMKWYATPVDVVSGPYGWPAYTAKAPLGIVPVEEDGSANFYAPAEKQLYFQVLDKDFNELQRMRSVV
ncbi:MAG: hypothetical protein HY318_13580, partial [Armatimonadetes bacterium]|nr:hypothetical protein [Armatimonadota bacterium]